MGGTSSVNNRPPYNLFLNENEELPKLYQLVDLFGGGRLVELMKEAMRTKNFDEVDKCIRTEVKEYLYNEGNGDHVCVLFIYLFLDFEFICSFLNILYIF